VSLDLAESTTAIAAGVVAFDGRRDLVAVAGRDARNFLQGQLTQDLSPLVPGDSVESLVLSPQGRIDAYLQVSCRSEEHFLLAIDAGFGPALLERLARFRLRVKAELSLGEGRVLAVRGPGAGQLRASLAPEAVCYMIDWPGMSGFDLVVDDGGPVLDCRLGDPRALEFGRIRAGLPRMGAELDGRTIPQETPLTPRCISFTKGCFTGQELVARLDARGSNVARHLRGLVIAAGVTARLPEAGSPIVVDGEEVGSLTSCACSEATGTCVALGYVHRRIEPPCAAAIALRDGPPLEAEIRALPMTSASPAG
jgi:folate-binding protein YgfZ